MDKIVYILRGVSGCGKSTFAKILAGDTGVICSADDYFVGEDGVYRFDFNKLELAHNQCKERFVINLINNTSTIVVDNVNTGVLDVDWYLGYAKKYNYQVFSLIVENRHYGKNSHGVSEETLNKQESALKNSLKLR